MNDLLTKRIERIVKKTIEVFVEYITRAEAAAVDFERQWKVTPDNPLLDKKVQAHIKNLIKGVDVKDATEFELRIAGELLDKVLKRITG